MTELRFQTIGWNTGAQNIKHKYYEKTILCVGLLKSSRLFGKFEFSVLHVPITSKVELSVWLFATVGMKNYATYSVIVRYLIGHGVNVNCLLFYA